MKCMLPQETSVFRLPSVFQESVYTIYKALTSRLYRLRKVQEPGIPLRAILIEVTSSTYDLDELF